MTGTRYNPRLLVRINGQLVATADPVGGLAPLVAVADVAVTWGRARVWEHQNSAQATLSLIDRLFTYGPHLGNQLANAPITLAYDVPGVLAERTFFRGNITDYNGIVLPPDPRTGESRGMRLDISAASIMTALANVKTGVFAQTGNMIMGIRWGNLENFIAPGFVADTVYDVTNTTESWWNRPLVARTYNDESVVSAQRQLLDMMGDQQVYDPHANVLTFATRRRIEDARGYGVPIVDAQAGGLVLRVPGGEAVPTLDAAEFSGGKLAKSTEARVTSIRVTGYTDSTGATTTTGAAVITDPLDSVAPVPLTIASDWFQAADRSVTLTRWNGLMAREAKSWRPEPITHQTQRLGGIPAEAIPILLNGTDYSGVVYFGRSDWARAGVVPAWSVIGGTIRYVGGDPGWWSPSVQLAAPAFYEVSGGLGIAAARTPANCDVGAAHPLKAADLSPALSAADARFWTTPYTG